jgi:hypothetical protein
MRDPVVTAGALRGEAYGVAFEVRVDDPRLRAAVRARFPPGWRTTRRPAAVLVSLVHEASSPGMSVRIEGRLLARGLTHPQALDVLESELQLSVARLARPEVFVHAGVVAVKGRAILVPGRSGAGKTTLVRALVAAGATYYSDEYAVLDGQGRVHPYARRPSVRVRQGRKERHPVPRGRGRGPVPVGLVVETRYRAGARWSPVALSAGERVLALLANTVPARDRPAECSRSSPGRPSTHGESGAIAGRPVGPPGAHRARPGRRGRASSTGEGQVATPEGPAPRDPARGSRRRPPRPR